MQNNLILFLHNDNANPDWILHTSDEEHIVINGDPSQLLQLPGIKDVTVFVPAEDVLLVEVKLPKLNRSRLIEALPYALEDQLIEDVDLLHFAVSDYQSDGYNVAIIARQKMENILAQLSAWQIRADKILPLSLALPLAPAIWHAFIVNELVVVRRGPYQAFVCDINNMNDVLNLAHADASEITKLEIHNFTSNAVANSLKLAMEIEETLIPASNLLSHLTLNLQTPQINLLQDRYAPKKSNVGKARRLMQLGAAFAGLWVVLLFVYPAVSYFILNQRYQNLETEIKSIYKRNFPLATNMVAPRARMEDKLKKMNARGTQDQFFIWIADLGKAFSDENNIKLKRIDFQNNQLSVAVNAATAEDFAGFVEALTQEGLSVKQQNATMVAERMNATIVIE